MDHKTILIVEDEASIAEVLALYLKRADFRTFTWRTASRHGPRQADAGPSWTCALEWTASLTR
jgi:DNA-binding response OmpR family regulator